MSSLGADIIPLHPEHLAEDETYESFLSFFLGERADSTAHAYLKDVTYLGEYLNRDDVLDVIRFLLDSPPLLVNRRIQEWKHAMEHAEPPLSPNTINRRIATVRSVLHSARSLGLTSVELCTRNVLSDRTRDVRGPERDVVCKMLELLSLEDTPTATRNLAIASLASILGLRRQEICSLDLDDLDLSSSRILVSAKGGRKASLSLPPGARTAITSWLHHRGLAEGALFLNLSSNSKGERLSGTSVYRIVRQAGELADSPTPIRPHGLRRYAINAAVAKFGLAKAAKYARHRDVRSTMQYVDIDETAQSEISEFLAEEFEITSGAGGAEPATGAGMNDGETA